MEDQDKPRVLSLKELVKELVNLHGVRVQNTIKQIHFVLDHVVRAGAEVEKAEIEGCAEKSPKVYIFPNRGCWIKHAGEKVPDPEASGSGGEQETILVILEHGVSSLETFRKTAESIAKQKKVWVAREDYGSIDARKGNPLSLEGKVEDVCDRVRKYIDRHVKVYLRQISAIAYIEREILLPLLLDVELLEQTPEEDKVRGAEIRGRVKRWICELQHIEIERVREEWEILNKNKTAEQSAQSAIYYWEDLREEWLDLQRHLKNVAFGNTQEVKNAKEKIQKFWRMLVLPA